MKNGCSSQTTRHIVLVDIENLAGAPCPTIRQVEEAKKALQGVIVDFDQVPCVVACNHRAAPAVSFAFPKALRRWRSGKDGADLALVYEMDDLRVMSRYQRVTLCSGDGIFAEPVATLAEAGIDTTVVSIEGHLSKRLELAAKTVVKVQWADRRAA